MIDTMLEVWWQIYSERSEMDCIHKDSWKVMPYIHWYYTGLDH